MKRTKHYKNANKQEVNLKNELHKLLLIQAPSGKEVRVREFLQPRLAELVDEMHVDHVGNLLAVKQCGTGEGATIMLSAHMDSVSNIVKNRKVYEDNGVFYPSAGVLGADDRAGIAIIMDVLRRIDTYSFDGTIKVAFTISEEIGCVGSSAMDLNWYDDVNLAIVVDRKGNRDIVTGCGSPYNFCSKQVGEFFEHCSAILDEEWKSVGGGVSDAMTFSDNGIHSVNLSAGYYNEHTDKEFVVLSQCRDTVNLILQALVLVNSFYEGFGEVPANYYNSYTQGYYYSKNSAYGEYDQWWQDNGIDSSYASQIEDAETVIWEQTRQNAVGKITLYDHYTGFIEMYQKAAGKNAPKSIYLNYEEYDEMMDAYLAYNNLPSMARIRAMVKAEKDSKKGISLNKPSIPVPNVPKFASELQEKVEEGKDPLLAVLDMTDQK